MNEAHTNVERLTDYTAFDRSWPHVWLLKSIQTTSTGILIAVQFYSHSRLCSWPHQPIVTRLLRNRCGRLSRPKSPRWGILTTSS